LTGRYPTKIGYEFTPVTPAASYAISLLGDPKLPGIFHSSRRKDVNETIMILPSEFPTFAEIFQNDPHHIYRTLFLGKWHNGNDRNFKAITRGFDEKLAINIISSYLPTSHPENVDCILDDTLDRFLRANIRYQIEKNNGPYFEPKGYVTDYLGDEAVRAIEANKEDPFLMYLSFTAPHTPLQALRSDYESLEKFADLDHCSKVYGSMLLSLDRAVGKVLNALETLGLSENTLVIFSSDNGSPSYINLPTTNQPYRGWKASHFEGGIKVPLLMKWPKRIPPGIVLKEVVSHIDIFPTIANAAGIAHDGEAIDGKDLLPIIEHHQDLYSHLSQDINKSQATCETDGFCEGDDERSLSPTLGHEFLFWRSGHVTTLRTKEWKIQVAGRPNKVWLFYLLNDPTERNNLANHPKFQADLDRMIAKLHFVNSTQSPPLWPALSETPVLIDKIGSQTYEVGDEFVYWPN
jgi:arylsulfatase A-like enzyme